MKIKIWLIFGISLIPTLLHANEILFITSQLKMIDAEVIKHLEKRTKTKVQLRIYPWARAYLTALEKKNVLIGPFSRTNTRETMFHWVGTTPIYSQAINLYRLTERNDIIVNNLEDAKKYKIGAVRGYSSTKYLLDRGFTEGRHVNLVAREYQNVLMLFANRIDLFLLSDLMLSVRINELELDITKVESAYTVFNLNDYFAFSQQTSKDIVKQFQSAMEKIEKEGIIDNLKQKYKGKLNIVRKHL